MLDCQKSKVMKHRNILRFISHGPIKSIPIKETLITLFMKKDRGSIAGLNAKTHKVTRAVFEMRKRDGGGNIMIRQGITGIMNVKAYTADLHSSKLTHRDALVSANSLIICSPTVTHAECYVKAKILTV